MSLSEARGREKKYQKCPSEGGCDKSLGTLTSGCEIRKKERGMMEFLERKLMRNKNRDNAQKPNTHRDKVQIPETRER